MDMIIRPPSENTFTTYGLCTFLGRNVKRIGILEPANAGHLLARRAYENGYSVAVFSVDRESRRIQDQVRPFVQVIQIDTNDTNGMITKVRAMQAESPGLAAFIAGREHNVALAAEVARAVGLEGPSASTAQSLRNKQIMRERLHRSEIAIPRWQLVRADQNFDDLSIEVPFPAVVKPIDGAGSLNVRRVESRDEAIAALRVVREDHVDELGMANSRHALVEEYIEGQEFSVEGLCHEGRPQFLSVTRKFLGPEPSFVEVGHLTPSGLSEKTICHIHVYMEKVLHALGYQQGPFHAELRLRENQPILIEVAGRLPGDYIVEIIERSTGADMLLGTVQSMCREPLTSAVATKVSVAVGIRYFERPGLKTYSRIKGWTKLLQCSDVKRSEIIIGPGQEIPPPPSTNALGRLGFIICEHEDPSTLSSLLEKHDRSLEFVPCTTHDKLKPEVQRSAV